MTGWDSVCSFVGETIVTSLVTLSVSAKNTIAPAVHVEEELGRTRKRIESPGCCRSPNQLPSGVCS